MSCSKCIRSTAVAVSGTTMTITIPATTLSNHQRICVAVCQSIPSTITPDTTVAITDGTSTLNLINPCGNYVYADQIRCRKVLPLLVATDVPLAIVLQHTNLCCTQHVFPVLNGPTTTAPASETTPSTRS